MLAITYDGRFVLAQLILGDQSVLKRVFLSRRQTPTVWIQPACYFSNSQLTHTLTSRALPGIVLRISHLVLFARSWCMTHCTGPCSSAPAAYVTGDAHGVTTDDVLQSECIRCRNDHTVVFRASSVRGSSVLLTLDSEAFCSRIPLFHPLLSEHLPVFQRLRHSRSL